MFTPEQQAIIATNRFKVAFFYDFNLVNGNVIKWTTLDYDYLGYSRLNSISGQDGVLESVGDSDTNTKVSIIGTPENLAAFNSCEGSRVSIQVGFYLETEAIEMSTMFSGVISAYGINRGVDNVSLVLELEDSAENSNKTNSRLLTQNDQLSRYPNDNCLRFINSTEEIEFWGKGL